MSKKGIAIVLLLCFATLSTALAGLETNVENAPLVSSRVGVGLATLAAARYPVFVYRDGWSTNDVCGRRLVGLSSTLIPGRGGWDNVAGLKTTVTIPESYRNNSKLLITWTIRVEGAGVLINPLSAGLCNPWSGSINETFKGGQVYSRAEVDTTGHGWVATGDLTAMTMPDGSTQTSYTPPPPSHDPTSTGSCLVNGPFGNTVKVRISWRNDTSLSLESKARYRNLIVTIVPSR